MTLQNASRTKKEKMSLQMKLGVRPKKESSLSSMLDSILLSYDQYSFSHWIPN
jgi:hypothetical protein